MAEAPLVSFVIPSYRSERTLEQTIESIFRLETSTSYEVIRVETGWERDQAPAIIRSERVLWRRSRLGPAAARNWGAAESSGRYLAFVDSDAILLPNWLEELLKVIQREGCSMLGGTVANANPEYPASRVLHLIEFSECLPGAPLGFRQAISTSNCLIVREAFFALKGFREDLDMFEDWEFCRRLPDRPFLCNRTGIRHLHRETWNEVLRHLEDLGYWSGRFRRDHPEMSGAWIRRLPVSSWLLLPLRLLRIDARRRAARLGSDYGTWGDQAGLVKGLFYWTRGFRRGISGRSPETGASRTTR